MTFRMKSKINDALADFFLTDEMVKGVRTRARIVTIK